MAICDLFKSKNAPRESVSEPAKKLLRYPLAMQDKHGKMKVSGTYRKGYPEGAVVHFTAGSSGSSSLSYGIKQGYCFFLIDRDGTVYQNFDLNKWGSHAGISQWPSLGSSVSKYLVGIEIANAGKLTLKNGKWVSWFGTEYDKTRTVAAKRYSGEQPGTYEAYTPEQEKSLKQLLLWLKRNNPDVFSFDLVLGHDEVSPNRKNDPGGALSMGMPELRKLLKKEV